MFERELIKVRERGYAIDNQENEIGGRCISAPILNQNSYPVAAISVSVPIHRIPEDQIGKFGSKLLEAVGEVSRIIGYR